MERYKVSVDNNNWLWLGNDTYLFMENYIGLKNEVCQEIRLYSKVYVYMLFSVIV